MSGIMTIKLSGGSDIGNAPRNLNEQEPALTAPVPADEPNALAAVYDIQNAGSLLPPLRSDGTHGAENPIDAVQAATSMDVPMLHDSDAADSVGRSFSTMPVVDKNFLITLSSANLNPVQITGITAGSNHCYRNSVLTALLSSPIVSRYLLVWYCTAGNGDLVDDTSSMLTAISQILAALFHNPASSQADIDTRVREFWQQFCYEKGKKGRNRLRASSWTWRSYRSDAFAIEEKAPQDAHEFLTWLLATMPRQFILRAPDQQSNGPLERFEWVFKSQSASRIICGKCQYPVRRRNETHADTCLVLHIPEVESTYPGLRVPQPSLTDLVKESFTTEMSMKCSRCKKTSDCIEERKLRHASALLMLTLSRGKSDPETSKMWKDCTAVAVPEQLDLTEHLNAHEFGEGSKVTYSLCSVVSHQGNQLDNGHYVSYVRGVDDKTKWYEINDHHVNQVSQSYFDDSAVGALSEYNYENRFTPYILFYEKDLESEVVVPGREARNVGEGESEDEEPTHWNGTMRDVTPSVDYGTTNTESQEEGSREEEGQEEEAQDEEGQEEALAWTMGAEEDKKSLPAVVLVKIGIGEVEVKLPRHIISHLNWKKKRDITIDVKLRAPKGHGINSQGNDHVEASLSDIQDEVYYSGRFQKEKKDKSGDKSIPAWNKFWKPAKRNADDLTENEIQEVKRVCREQKNGGGKSDAL